jgi:hypothetical protein
MLSKIPPHCSLKFSEVIVLPLPQIMLYKTCLLQIMSMSLNNRILKYISKRIACMIPFKQTFPGSWKQPQMPRQQYSDFVTLPSPFMMK